MDMNEPPSSITPSTTPLSQASPPKKSARLAEKRKLREEAQATGSVFDDEFYFTPYKSCRSSSSPSTTPRKNNNTHNHNAEPMLTSISTSAIGKEDEFPSVDDGGFHASHKSGSGHEDSSEEEKWFDALDLGRLGEVDLDEIDTTEKLITDVEHVRENNDLLINAEDLDLERGKELRGHVVTPIVNGERSTKNKSERRRQLAQQKKEYDKKRTVDRLLRKGQAKPMKAAKINKTPKPVGQMITYIINRDMHSISFPEGLDITVMGELPKSIQNAEKGPQQLLCGMEGCSQPKKYICSKTGVPVCSLNCYKQNFQESEAKIPEALEVQVA